jgi:hypothetical protein
MSTSTLPAQPIDHFINQQRQEIMHLEFDDPEFNHANNDLVLEYREVARWDNHHVTL